MRKGRTVAIVIVLLIILVVAYYIIWLRSIKDDKDNNGDSVISEEVVEDVEEEEVDIPTTPEEEPVDYGITYGFTDWNTAQKQSEVTSDEIENNISIKVRTIYANEDAIGFVFNSTNHMSQEGPYGEEVSFVGLDSDAIASIKEDTINTIQIVRYSKLHNIGAGLYADVSEGVVIDGTADISIESGLKNPEDYFSYTGVDGEVVDITNTDDVQILLDYPITTPIGDGLFYSWYNKLSKLYCSELAVKTPNGQVIVISVVDRETQDYLLSYTLDLCSNGITLIK